MPDPETKATAAPASEPAKPADNGKTTQPTAKPAEFTRASAAAALDAALEAELGEDNKPAGDPKQPDAGKATNTDNQPSDDSSEKSEYSDEKPKEFSLADEPVVDFGSRKEPEGKDDEDEADEHKTGFPKDWPEAAVKNLLKEREKRKEAKRAAEEAASKVSAAEAKLKEIEAENAKLKSSAPAAAQAPELVSINSAKDLEEYRAKQQELRDACEYYADGYPEMDKDGKPVVDEEGNPVLKYNRRQVAEIKMKAQRALETEIPKRAEFLKRADEALRDTVTTYPWLKNEKSKAAQMVWNVLRNPETLTQNADFVRAVVWMVKGRELELQARNSSVKPAAEKPPMQPSKPAAERTVVPASDKSAQREAASAAIRSGKGGKKALEEFLAAEMSED